MYVRFIKPVIDTLLALLLLIVGLPFALVTIVALIISLKGNPFFTQSRGGRNNTIFYIYKFRTMTNEEDHSGQPLPDSQRLTRVGNLVRKLSLDEIPQLINVLKGEMSLIGPRPFMSEYLDIYSDVERRRHLLKPGITGWAQVNGRNSISWKERFALDIYYVENVSFLLDIKILILTGLKVIMRDSVNQDQGTTMEKYNGNN